MTPNLRELECFLAVVDHGSITRAAAALYIAQPSLSQTIRRLEADLGVELFRRIGRGLVLTPAGEAIIGPSRQILRDLAQVRSVAQGFLGLGQGRLDLAVAGSLTTNFIAAWVGYFRRQYPGIDLRLVQHDGDVDELVQLIRGGSTELAYSFAPSSRPGIECHRVGSGEIVLALPPGWNHALPDPAPISALADLPFVHHRHPGWADVHKILDEAGFDSPVVVEINDPAGLVPLVLAGAGAAFLPVRQAIEAQQGGATLLETLPLLTRHIYALHATSPLSLPAQAFLALSRENLDRWGQSVRSRRTRGMSLIEAVLDSDQHIRAAYARFLTEDSGPHPRS